MIMKKLKILIACAGIFLVTGCSQNVHTGKSTAGNSVNNVINSQIADSSGAESTRAFSTDLVKSKNDYDSVDYDLTTMSSDMVYATVYQMMTNPDKYVGKVFKMVEHFIHHITKIQTNIIITALYKMQQHAVHREWNLYGMMIPMCTRMIIQVENSNIVVTGVFETYREDGDKNLYCRLSDASLELDNQMCLNLNEKRPTSV